MNWYWIVLIVFGYLVMWILISIVHNKIEDPDDRIISVGFGFFWPVTMWFGLVDLILKKILHE